MRSDRSLRPLEWVLRIGAVMEFVGHGALGIIGVAAWVSYFAVVGIGPAAAHGLMPLVGLFDVALAASILLFPSRALIGYMAAWGFWTALLRPLSGESIWEAVERAGNYGALLALLLACGGGWRGWLRFSLRDPLGERDRAAVAWTLRLTTVLLLLGHGALGLLGKPLFATHYASIGLHATWTEPAVGAFECLLAAAVLVRPARGILLFVAAWKLATELLSPIAGSTLWVFIEHGGSYVAPLALALLSEGSMPDQPRPRADAKRREESAVARAGAA
jgi:hypothetical protein